MTTACLLVAFLVSAEPEAGLRIRSTSDATRVEVVAPLPEKVQAQLPAGKVAKEKGEELLRLALVDAETGKEGPAIFGNYERRKETLVFTPRFPLTHGQRYRATLDLPGSKPTSTEYRVPAQAAAEPPVVEKVYPSAAVLPANQLKFYIHFSKSMQESKEIFDHIRLFDGDGKEVEEPWRRTELWSADARRLTLWIHPGRIKKGVNLREQEGPVLRPDKSYSLVIGTEVVDADGRPLAKPFTKKFRTGGEEHGRPLVDGWKVQAPAANGEKPLTLEFPRPLDRALLDRFLVVTDAAGKPVAGKIEVGSEERSWLFHPEQPWQAAEYTVKVDGRLEDLAGNTLLRPFDVDLEAPAPTAPKLSVAFRAE
jgi:hypothetical protein